MATFVEHVQNIPGFQDGLNAFISQDKTLTLGAYLSAQLKH